MFSGGLVAVWRNCDSVAQINDVTVCRADLELGSKGRYCSYHLRITRVDDG